MKKELDYDGNIPEAFREVQQCLDSFVEVNYETMLGMISGIHLTEADIQHYHSKAIDIIRNNPPLASLPKYLRDGREDYLWYSEFFDDAGKDVYWKYSNFVILPIKIDKTNYTKELAKIDLPYFRELVDLVSLERLYIEYEKKLPKEIKPIEEKRAIKETTEPKSVSKSKPKVSKRSYQPKLDSKQYAQLADCIESIKLFRLKIKIAELKKLLAGKLTEPLQVANQKSLVYLFDLLSEHTYIKKEWISVADGNKDFVSFRTEGNKERYGDNTHYINMQQLLNCRNRNKNEHIHGLENIENMIDELNKLNLE